MQWIINEHHLAHTTGERSGRPIHNALLSFFSFLCSLSHFALTVFMFFFPPPHTHCITFRSRFSRVYSFLLLACIHLSLLPSPFPSILRDPQWPPWQASRGIPHSNSVIQPSRRLIRWPCALKRRSLLWVIATLSLARVHLKCCKSAPIIPCKRTPGLGISPLHRAYTYPFGLLFFMSVSHRGACEAFSNASH